MKPWRKLLALSPGEARLLASATCFVLLAEMALRLLPPRTVLALFQRRKTVPDTQAIDALDRFVGIADRYAPGTRTCLRRAVALGYFCRWRGIDAALCIGVRREQGTLQAHAWVRTDDGRTFGFSEEPAYAPLSRPPEALDSCAGRN